MLCMPTRGFSLSVASCMPQTPRNDSPPLPDEGSQKLPLGQSALAAYSSSSSRRIGFLLRRRFVCCAYNALCTCMRGCRQEVIDMREIRLAPRRANQALISTSERYLLCFILIVAHWIVSMLETFIAFTKSSEVL